MSDVIELTKELINRASVTPDDGGCQKVITNFLQNLNFKIENLPFSDVSNLWAIRGGKGPLFCFAGHTDVVPPGPLDAWKTDPFVAEERDEFLYGRGAADMKGSLAAMLTATERFISKNPKHKGSIAFIITSDEEGDAINGTAKVVEHLKQSKQKIDWCLVGEPSSTVRLGDTIKIGRRGSLCGTLLIRGKQGHVAYPQLAENPIHRASQAIAELCAKQWDEGNEDFPPTSFQISNVHAGTGAHNVIPGELEVQFNLRYSTETDDETLSAEIEKLLDDHQLNYKLDWHHSGKPFLTTSGKLISAVTTAITEVTTEIPKHSTSGGSSDGRFIAPTGAEVIEFGPLHRTIHKPNECVSLDDLDALEDIYYRVLENLLLK